MKTAMLNVKIDPKVKREAGRVAEDLGFSLSAIVNASLKKLISEKRVEFSLPEIPNARLRKAFREADKMIKSGKYKIYKTHEDLEKALLS